jgi:hypothetical protein
MFADRVKETSTTTGTGTLNLAGAATNFIGFVAGIGDGNTCYYAIVHQTLAEWEVGIGAVTDAGTDTLSRTTVLASSNSGSLVNFSAGTKDVFNTIAANDIELSMTAISAKKNLVVPAGQGVYCPTTYEVPDGFTLEVEAGAIMEVG